MSQEGTAAAAPEQLALLRATVRAARTRPPRAGREPAADRPIARVAVDVTLAHLGRPFDYLVSVEQAAAAEPGVRVRVRFSGRLVSGFVLERLPSTDHEGRLSFLQSVISPERVLTPEVLRLAHAVADHYAGSLSDVLRLAVPGRHARAETAVPERVEDVRVNRPEIGGWERYERGPALLEAMAGGRVARAVWQALPGAGWPHELARLALCAASAGRGALVVLPDGRDVDRLDQALRTLAGQAGHVVLTAALGPETRYRRWLQVLRGHHRVVIGTRAAMFAPVRDLGLVAMWDDGDDLHEEPRAPYPHVRTVLALRSRLQEASLVVGSLGRSVESAAWLSSGWAHDVAASRPAVRRAAPRVVSGQDRPDQQGHRLPSVAWRAASTGLESGPVLVQVPRVGYAPGLACDACREPARCLACCGPLAAGAAGTVPACRWCGVPAQPWQCPRCDGARLRATVVGAGRTAEELGRAFPRIPVRTSGDFMPVLAEVDDRPALVVATVGAEPVAQGGYAAALLLDGWALLSRPDLRAGEEALRRWLAAAALVRRAADGGQVVVMADPAAPAVQALIRWDPTTFADRELAERGAVHLPPAVTFVALSGDAAAVEAFLADLDVPAGATVLGPVQTPGDDDRRRVLLRVMRSSRRQLVTAVRATARVRSAAKDVGPVRVQVDPVDIG